MATWNVTACRERRRRGSRCGLLCLRGSGLRGSGLPKHLAHRCAQPDPGAQPDAGSGSALVLRCIAHRLRALVLHVGAHVTDRAHRGAGVDGLGRFLGGGDGLHVERVKRDAARGELFLRLRAHPGPQFLDEGRHLDDRLAHLADEIHHLAEDDAAEETLDVARAVEILRPHDLGDEKLRVGNLDGVGAEAGHARHAQDRIGDGDGLRRPPLHIRQFSRGDEVHFGLERRLSRECLADQVNENGDVGGRNRVPPRPEGVQRLSVAEEDRGLGFADN